jgi:predicted nucleic acid-binding protein
LALYYLETSALVKLYVREPGTERLLKLVSRTNNHRFAVLTLSRVEFHSAIRRREREGDIDPPLALRLLRRFGEHMEMKFLKQVINDALLDLAASLVDRHPLRAYDAVQLAGCLTLRASSGKDDPTFVSSDQRLIDVAGAEGLPFLDPASAA